MELVISIGGDIFKFCFRVHLLKDFLTIYMRVIHATAVERFGHLLQSRHGLAVTIGEDISRFQRVGRFITNRRHVLAAAIGGDGSQKNTQTGAGGTFETEA